MTISKVIMKGWKWLIRVELIYVSRVIIEICTNFQGFRLGFSNKRTREILHFPKLEGMLVTAIKL